MMLKSVCWRLWTY